MDENRRWWWVTLLLVCWLQAPLAAAQDRGRAPEPLGGLNIRVELQYNRHALRTGKPVDATLLEDAKDENGKIILKKGTHISLRMGKVPLTLGPTKVDTTPTEVPTLDGRRLKINPTRLKRSEHGKAAAVLTAAIVVGAK